MGRPSPLDAPPQDRAPGRGDSGHPGVRISRVATTDGVNLYAGSRPDPEAGGFDEQLAEAYRNLGRALAEEGAQPRHVVTEKVFVDGIDGRWRSLEATRRDFYGDGGKAAGVPRPAATTVVQPPAIPGCRCEIQAQAYLPRHRSEPCDGELLPLPGFGSGRIVRHGGARFVHLANLTGGVPGDGLDFAAQAAAMFRLAAEILERQGLTFREVIRTWLYLPDLERDYAALNRVRGEFFGSVGLAEFPASTGIQGRVPPPGRECGLDLLALEGGGAVAVRSIHSPTMNEAAEYGALFSRGTRVDFADRSEIYLSGTASIDASGRVVHEGDPEGQASVMLDNVERLLAGQGGDLSHLVTAITYLKRPRDLPVFESALRSRGFPPGVPHTICVADVCRPAWLAEMEALAVLPRP